MKTTGFWTELGYALRALADLLMPRRCLVCGEPLETLPSGADRRSLAAHLCPACAEDLPETFFWSWADNPAEEQLWHRVGIIHAASLYFYRQGSDYTRLVQAVKYEGNLRLGRVLGRELGLRMAAAGRFSVPTVDMLGESIPGIQAIVPVPLHPLRRWKRGYNQAEVIARGLAEGLAGYDSAGVGERPLPIVTSLLRRARYTRTQTRLSADEKQRNVAGAFVLRPSAAARLQAAGIRHLLIVDDVITTGATLSEAIKPLLPHFRVSVVTIAFVE